MQFEIMTVDDILSVLYHKELVLQNDANIKDGVNWLHDNIG